MHALPDAHIEYNSLSNEHKIVVSKQLSPYHMVP